CGQGGLACAELEFGFFMHVPVRACGSSGSVPNATRWRALEVTRILAASLKPGGFPMPVNPFVSLFGRSPIGPMQQHMAKAHECAANLVPFFQAATARDWQRVEQIQKE